MQEDAAEVSDDPYQTRCFALRNSRGWLVIRRLKRTVFLFADNKKAMTCEDLKFELSFYLEDELTADERLAVEDHLSACPLCRAELAEYRDLSNQFKTVGTPQISSDMVTSIQRSLRTELVIASREPELSFSEKLQNWLRPKLVPYGVGTFASLIFFVLLTIGMMTPLSDPREDAPVLLVNGLDMNNENTIRAFEYANERTDVRQESPSLNPDGALIAAASAMTRTRRGNRSSEIVVVADVFSNGIARISEVVQPSPDERTMRELERAMEQEVSTSPAFVPAQLDKRSDVVQIVLKIHEVNVSSDERKPARKSRIKL